MTDYYLHPTSGNDANSGLSELLPIQNYTKSGFMAALVAGDFVAQAGGTIWDGGATNRIIHTVSGTASAPIKMGTYGTGKAVIDGAGTRDIGIFGTNVQWIVVDNFEIRNYTRAGCYWGTSTDGTIDRNITMSNLLIHNLNGNTNATGIQGWGKHLTIEDCEIYEIESDGIWVDGDYLHVNRVNIHDTSNMSGGLGDNLQTTAHCDGLLIENSTFDHTNNSDKQIMVIAGVATSGGTIRYCTFRGLTSTGAGGISIDGVNGVNFLCNRVEAYDGIYYLTPASSGVVAGNLFIGDGTGVAIGCNTAVHSIKAYHNTMYNWLMAVAFVNNNGVANNNISHTTTLYAINAGSKSHNCIYNDANISSLTYDGTHILSDPLLDVTYALTAQSPCRRAGVYVGDYSDLNQIPFGSSAVDMGAIRYVGDSQREIMNIVEADQSKLDLVLI